MAPAQSGLTIFFPCYNDRETIPVLVEQAERVARDWTENYEILVIDDGSGDGSREVLKNLERTHPRLRIILHDRNQGYGATLQTGFREASKEWVFYTDGDGQYDVAELKNWFVLMTPDIDMINGYKMKRADPWHRKLLGSLYTLTIKMLFQIKLRDVNCDFRLMRHTIFEKIKLTAKSGAIGLELIKQVEAADFKVMEQPVRHFPRRYGRSQFLNPKKIIETVFDLIRLRCKIRTQ